MAIIIVATISAVAITNTTTSGNGNNGASMQCNGTQLHLTTITKRPALNSSTKPVACLSRDKNIMMNVTMVDYSGFRLDTFVMLISFLIYLQQKNSWAALLQKLVRSKKARNPS